MGGDRCWPAAVITCCSQHTPDSRSRQGRHGARQPSPPINRECRARWLEGDASAAAVMRQTAGAYCLHQTDPPAANTEPAAPTYTDASSGDASADAFSGQ